MGKSSGRVAIVGAGISGLATAYYLKKHGLQKGLVPELHLFESTDRLGGVIRSELDRGYLLEWGPENFVSYKPKALELISELGIASEVVDSNESIRQTYVVQGGRLIPLPQGMEFLVPLRLRSFWPTPLISTRGKLRVLMEPFVGPSRGEISVYDFFQRRLGTEFTDALVEPLVSAIYGGDVRRLSMVSALGELHRMEQGSGSLWKAMRSREKRSPSSSRSLFLALRSGMIRLVEALAEHLEGVTVSTSTGVREISPQAGTFRLGGDGWTEAFDSVVICTPAGVTARLLEPFSAPGARALAEIPYSSTILVYLAYPEAEFSHPLNGFGFVTPRTEPCSLSACTWVSRKFPGRCPPGSVLLRCAVRDSGEDLPAQSTEKILETAHRELTSLLRIDCSPTLSWIHQVGARMPQFTLGHELRRESIESALNRHAGLFCAGAFYGGVGISDCIQTASQTVERVLTHLEESTR